ncbi:MAG TPA: site-specific integrase [Pyrinomonadaceae bacterium]|nr:site-specific integrase [Pyrinomonadaceae bacterium]
MDEKKPRPRGSIKDLGGGKFRIAVYLGEDARGKRSYHNETLYNSTPAKAQKRLTAIQAKVDDGTYFQPSHITLKEAVAIWRERMERKVKNGELKLSTLQAYDSYVEYYARWEFNETQLRNVTVEAIQQFVDALQDEGLKSSTIRVVCVPLWQTLKLMVKYGRIKENPTLHVELPAMNEPKKAKVFDEKEVFQFIEAAAQFPDDFIFLFALITGMRPGEFIGLRYPYLELDRDENGVERGLCRVMETVVRNREGGWYFSTPKTEKSKRPIYFPSFMLHELMARKRVHLENLRRLGKTHELVFANSRGEPYDRDWLRNTAFMRVLDRAGIPREGRSLYSLRRSTATLSMLLGESPKTLSDKLGHTSVEFTQNEYVDVLPIGRKTMSDRLETFLFRRNFAEHGAEGVM